MATDSVTRVRFGRYAVPLAFAVSDVKVATGRQRPLTHIDVLTCRMHVPALPGLGLSLTEESRSWLLDRAELTAGGR